MSCRVNIHFSITIMFAKQSIMNLQDCRNNDMSWPDTPYPQLTIIGLLGICLLDRSEIVSRKLDKSQQLTKRSPVNVRYPFFLGLPNRGCCYQLVVFASVSACLVLCVCRLQAGLVPSLGRARADAGSAEPGRGGAGRGRVRLRLRPSPAVASRDQKPGKYVAQCSVFSSVVCRVGWGVCILVLF